MNLIIDRAKIEDAEKLLEYLKIVSKESKNLLITKEQIDILTITYIVKLVLFFLLN